MGHILSRKRAKIPAGASPSVRPPEGVNSGRYQFGFWKQIENRAIMLQVDIPSVPVLVMDEDAICTVPRGTAFPTE
jgi:hypothetical protein